MCHPLHFNVPYEFILSPLHSQLLQDQMYSLWKLKQAKFLSKSISLFLSKDHLNSSHVSLEALCCWKIGQKRAGWQLRTTVEINSRPFSGLLGLTIWETYFKPSFTNWLSQCIARIHLGSHHEKHWETQIEYFIDFVAKHFPFLNHYPFLQVKRALPSLWGLFRISLSNDGTVHLGSEWIQSSFVLWHTLWLTVIYQYEIILLLFCLYKPESFWVSFREFPLVEDISEQVSQLVALYRSILGSKSLGTTEPFWKPNS